MPELKPLPCPACNETDILLLNSAEMGIHYVCRCGCAGPFAKTQKAAIAAWNYLPRALAWTTEPPKVPGWYWYRWSNHIRMPYCIEVHGPKDYLMFGSKCNDLHQQMPVTTNGPEWAGPIPEPLEPEEGQHDA